MAEEHEGLGEELTQILEDLRSANYEFDKGVDKREVLKKCLWSAIELIRITQPGPEFLFHPLVELYTALEELNHGTVAPFLKPETYPNRHRDPASKDYLRAVAAAAMSWLMNIGKSRDQAASQIADWLNEFGMRNNQNGAPILAITVSGWRDRINQGKASKACAEFYEFANSLKSPSNEVGLATANIKACVKQAFVFSS